jgi:outer membrane protein TolC
VIARRFYAISVTLACLAEGTVRADEPPPTASAVLRVNADEIVERAAANNPIVAASSAEVEMAEAELFRAWGRYIPRFTADAFFTWIPSARGDALNGYLDFSEWGPLVRTEVDGEVTLYAFGQLEALRDAARAGIDVAQARRKVALAELTFLARQAYFGAVYARQALDVMNEGQKYLDRAKRRLEELEETDSPEFDPVDLMKMRVQEAATVEGRAELEKGLAVALEGMRAVMALPHTAQVEPAESELSPVGVELLGLTEYYAAAFEDRPELAVANAQALKALAGQDERFADFFPRLGLRGFYDFAYSPVAEDQRSPFANDPFNVSNGGVALSMRWTLDLGQQIGRYRESSAAVDKALREAEALMLKVRVDVAEAWHEATRQRKLMDVQRDAMKAARGWLIAKSDLYDTGFCSIDDVSGALVEFFRRRLGYLQSIYNFNIATAKLSRVVGRDVRTMLAAPAASPE